MTALELEQFLYDKVKKFLAGTLSGGVYKSGIRPALEVPNEHKEDAVVGVLTGTGAELQRGTCYVNVYIPDIEISGGYYVQNKTRCAEIAKKINNLDVYLRQGENIYFTKPDMIVVLEEEKLREHFVSLKLEFKVLQTY